MGILEFVLVLVSIVIGLAMAELFGGIARVLRGDLRPYWVHSIWVLLVLLLQVQSWWSAWGVPVSEQLQFSKFVTLLVEPGLLFVAAALLFPERGQAGELRSYYYSRRRSFFVVLAAIPAWNLLLNWTTMGFHATASPLRLVHAATLFSLAFVERPRIHAILAIASVAALSFYIYEFNPDLITLERRNR